MAALRFEELVNKIMKDPKFRAAIESDPAKALQSVDVKATPDLVQSLKSVDWKSIHKVNDHYKSAQGIST